MAITEKTILNFGTAVLVTNETANNLDSPAVGTDLVGISLGVTGVTFDLITGFSANSATSPGPGADLTDQQINSANMYNAAGSISCTLTFPVAHGPVDIRVYNCVDGFFTGQDNMTASAIGLTTVSESRGLLLATDIGSNNPNGEFFTLLNVTPDASNQIVIQLDNDEAAPAGLQGIVLFPAAAANPVLSAPTNTKTSTSITPSVSTDTVAGTVYAVAVDTGAGVPSAAQIIAGTDSLDAATPNSNSAVSASPQALPALAGLSASTGYDIYLVQVDGTNSNVVSMINVITDAETTQTSFSLTDNEAVTSPVASTAFSFAIYTGIGGTLLETGTFSTDVNGDVTISGLTSTPAGSAYILCWITATPTFVSPFAITVT